MLILTSDMVNGLIDMHTAVNASATAFILVSDGRAVVPTRHQIGLDARGSVSFFMPGYVADNGVLGIKVGSLAVGNAERGLPSSFSTVLLLDKTTGQAAALIEATWLTSVRTGAGLGAATRALARPDSRVAAMIGAGGMAFHIVEAMLTACPGVNEVRLWNRSPARAEELREKLASSFGERCQTIVESELERAVREADVVSCCTATEAPLIRGDWVAPGTHVNLAGAHGPAMREGDDTLLHNAAVRTVDKLDAALASGELALAIAAGAARVESFLEIGAVLSGDRPGRRSPQDITWFKSVGIAAQDLVTAAAVLEAARRNEAGLEVPFYGESVGSTRRQGRTTTASNRPPQE